MGGPGSSRWGDYRARPRVEQAPVVLAVNPLGRLKPGTGGRLTWGDPEDPHAVVPFFVKGEAGRPVIALQVHVAWGDYEPADQEIRLVPIPMPQGGVRWVGLCPLCGRRRAAKLYVPPGGGKLMCRRCAGLLYRSSQLSDFRISALRADPVALAEALRSPKPGWELVIFTAYWKERQRLLRWLESRDPVQRFRALVELEPEAMAEVLREELGIPRRGGYLEPPLGYHDLPYRPEGPLTCCGSLLFASRWPPAPAAVYPRPHGSRRGAQAASRGRGRRR